MKRTSASFAIAVLVLIAAVMPTYAKAKTISGMWTFRIPEMSLRMELSQKGKTVTGTLQNPHNGSPIHLNGELLKGQLKFTGSSQGGEFEYKLSGMATLQPDGSLSGNLMSNAGDFMWTAVRVASK